MVLTFTGSISVAEGSAAENRTVLAAAVGCNLAWGIVDAAMYLMATFAERARSLATLRAIRHTPSFDRAHRMIVDALPPVVSMVMTPLDLEMLRVRLSQQPESVAAVSLSRTDFAGAAGVFLMVFLSTFPVVIPFLILHETHQALRASNAIAIVMLFLTGWSLGRHTGRRAWLTGLGMVMVGVVLVAVTVALGG